MSIDRLLTEPEAASLLRVSLRLLRTYRSVGSLPHVRIGRCVRYRPEDIASYLQAAAVDPMQEGVVRRQTNAPCGKANIIPFTQMASVRAKG